MKQTQTKINQLIAYHFKITDELTKVMAKLPHAEIMQIVGKPDLYREARIFIDHDTDLIVRQKI